MQVDSPIVASLLQLIWTPAFVIFAQQAESCAHVCVPPLEPLVPLVPLEPLVPLVPLVPPLVLIDAHAGCLHFIEQVEAAVSEVWQADVNDMTHF